MSNEDHFLTSLFLLLTIAATLQLKLGCQADVRCKRERGLIYSTPPHVMLCQWFICLMLKIVNMQLLTLVQNVIQVLV